MKTVEVVFRGKVVPIHYYEEGEGEPYVFIHGLMISHRSWKYLIFPYWKGSGRLIALDLPGFGESPPFSEEHTIERYADLVNAFLKKLKIKKPCIIGSSMGGAIALAFGMKYPKIPRAIVAHGSPYLGEDFPQSQREMLEMYRRLYPRIACPLTWVLLKNIFILNVCAVFLPEILRLLAHGTGKQRFHPDMLRDLKFSLTAASDVLWDIMHIDFRSGLRMFEPPILLVDGDRVGFEPINTLDKISSLIPESTIQEKLIFPGGHMAPYLYPERFVGGMREFFSKLERMEQRRD